MSGLGLVCTADKCLCVGSLENAHILYRKYVQ